MGEPVPAVGLLVELHVALLHRDLVCDGFLAGGEVGTVPAFVGGVGSGGGCTSAGTQITDVVVDVEALLLGALDAQSDALAVLGELDDVGGVHDGVLLVVGDVVLAQDGAVVLAAFFAAADFHVHLVELLHVQDVAVVVVALLDQDPPTVLEGDGVVGLTFQVREGVGQAGVRVVHGVVAQVIQDELIGGVVLHVVLLVVVDLVGPDDPAHVEQVSGVHVLVLPAEVGDLGPVL